MLNTVVDITNLLIEKYVDKTDTVLDLTMGNGNDTLTLAKKVGKLGKVYAFDIQKQAIINTRKLLKDSNINNALLILDSHENLRKYVNEEITFAVFNLGYLPKADKNIVTKYTSTIKAIKEILPILKVGGVINICAYTGHTGGMEEYENIILYLQTLNKREYNIINLNYINRLNTSPKMILIEKIK